MKWPWSKRRPLREYIGPKRGRILILAHVLSHEESQRDDCVDVVLRFGESASRVCVTIPRTEAGRLPVGTRPMFYLSDAA